MVFDFSKPEKLNPLEPLNSSQPRDRGRGGGSLWEKEACWPHSAEQDRKQRTGHHVAPAREGYGVVAGYASTKEQLSRRGLAGAARWVAGCLTERASRREGRSCGAQSGGRRVELAAGSAEGAARGGNLLYRRRR